MSECVCPCAPHWRRILADADDEEVEEELDNAWHSGNAGPPYSEIHHDYTHYRAVTLREARRRRLDLSVARY